MEEQILRILENCTDTDYIGIDETPVDDFNKIEAARQIVSHIMSFVGWVRDTTPEFLKKNRLFTNTQLYSYWLTYIFEP